MIFEKDSDRLNEEKVITTLKKLTGYEYVQLPKRYRVDFARLDNDKAITAWVEYKHRSHAFDTFPTFMVSTAKLTEGLILAGLTGIPFFLLASFKDSKANHGRKIFGLHISKEIIQTSHISMGGRKDRGEEGSDIEPVNYIDMPLFTEFINAKD